MTSRSDRIEAATTGVAGSAGALGPELSVDRLRAAGLSAVRPGSTRRSSLTFAEELALAFVLAGRGAFSVPESTIFRDVVRVEEPPREATTQEIREAIFDLGLAVYSLFGPVR